jgi:hypothetical protein
MVVALAHPRLARKPSLAGWRKPADLAGIDAGPAEFTRVGADRLARP